jgi:hypothetical protein
MTTNPTSQPATTLTGHHILGFLKNSQLFLRGSVLSGEPLIGSIDAFTAARNRPGLMGCVRFFTSTEARQIVPHLVLRPITDAHACHTEIVYGFGRNQPLFLAPDRIVWQCNFGGQARLPDQSLRMIPLLTLFWGHLGIRLQPENLKLRTANGHNEAHWRAILTTLRTRLLGVIRNSDRHLEQLSYLV